MLKRWIELRTQNSAWLLDMEFLLSSYECQWGRGCKGINTSAPDLGCCANGAYLDDKDVELVKKGVSALTPDIWQNYGSEYLEKVTEKGKFGIKKKAGYKTALVDPKISTSGCVFANREGFEGGTGCALHIAAVREGEDYRDWKPSICWQMPILVDYSADLEMNILRMFHWGKDEYDWFCSQDEITWVSANPLYITMEKELKKIVESYDKEAYSLIRQLCDTAFQQMGGKTEKKRIPVSIQVSAE